MTKKERIIKIAERLGKDIAKGLDYAAPQAMKIAKWCVYNPIGRKFWKEYRKHEFTTIFGCQNHKPAKWGWQDGFCGMYNEGGTIPFVIKDLYYFTDTVQMFAHSGQIVGSRHTPTHKFIVSRL